jgi:ferredoxin-type protein NapF
MRSAISRRDLLRGRLKSGSSPVRPPWALREFADLCDRCGDCLTACPEGILVRAADGTPRVDFASGGCSFCGECVKACGPGALAFPDDSTQSPWSVTAVIDESCLSSQGVVCRSCGETCPEGAIRFCLRPAGRADPVLEADACSGCGDCFRVCPVGAISLQARRTEDGE